MKVDRNVLRLMIVTCTLQFLLATCSASGEVFFSGVGFNLGRTRSSADHFRHSDLQVDMASGVTFSDYLAIRGQLGYRKLTADVRGDEPSSTQRFLHTNVVVYPTGDIQIYFTGGAGIYRITLEELLVSNTTSSWEYGLNAGVGIHLASEGHGPTIKLEMLQQWLPNGVPRAVTTISLGLSMGI